MCASQIDSVSDVWWTWVSIATDAPVVSPRCDGSLEPNFLLRPLRTLATRRPVSNQGSDAAVLFTPAWLLKSHLNLKMTQERCAFGLFFHHINFMKMFLVPLVHVHIHGQCKRTQLFNKSTGNIWTDLVQILTSVLHVRVISALLTTFPHRIKTDNKTHLPSLSVHHRNVVCMGLACPKPQNFVSIVKFCFSEKT